MSRVIQRNVSVTVNDTTWTFRRISALEQTQISLDVNRIQMEGTKEFPDNEMMAALTSTKNAVQFLLPFLQERVVSVAPVFVDDQNNPIPLKETLQCLESFDEVFQIFRAYTDAHRISAEEKKES